MYESIYLIILFFYRRFLFRISGPVVVTKPKEPSPSPDVVPEVSETKDQVKSDVSVQPQKRMEMNGMKFSLGAALKLICLPVYTGCPIILARSDIR